LFLTAKRLNGLRNQEASIAGLTKADPRFLRVLELMRKIQDADAVSMRVEQDAEKHQSTVIAIRSPQISEQALADSRKLRQLLGLSPDATEFKLVFGATAANDRELAIQTRSLLHILTLLAAHVEVPAEDVARHVASPGINEADKQGAEPVSIMRILSSKTKPAQAYVTLQYRDHWFWINDDDLKSKRTFAFMMMLFTLTDTARPNWLGPI